MYNGNNLLQTLDIESASQIEKALDFMAPSIAEYLIQESLEEEVAVPRSNFIQSVTVFGNYKIIVDYNDDIVVENLETNDELTSSFW